MAEGDLKWKYNVEGVIDSVIVTDSNGVIYCGTGYGVPAAKTKIVAVNPDGTLKWAFPSPFAYGFYIITGLYLSNDESVIYVVDGRSDIYALYTSDGTLKWGYGTSYGDAEDPGLSGIIVDANDNIYAGGDSWTASLFSLDSGGNLRWKIEGDDSYSGLIIGKNNTVVYYQDEQGLHEVQLSDGTVNWDYQGASWGCDGTGISIANDETIYFGDCDYFYAINPNGTEKWNFPIGNYAGTNNAIGSNNNIWFVDLYAGNTKVYVVNPSGVEVWHYDLPNWVGSGFAATGLVLDSNDIVYVGCWDHKLYAINPDGTLRWTYTAGDAIPSGIAFSPAEDTVYFGCDDGYLYAIEKLPAPPSCGIVAVGDKVMLCPIGNRHGNTVALKSGNAAVTDKALIAPLNNQAAQKLDFRNCKTQQGDKIICVPVSRAKKNILGLR